MPSTPAITDANLLRQMRITVEDIRDRLIDLEQEMRSQDQRNAVEG